MPFIVAVLILTMGFLVYSDPVSAQQVQPYAELPAGYDWYYYSVNGHYYALIGQMGWEEAINASDELGGYPVTITDADENEWLLDKFKDIWVLLGLYKINGSWKWVTGEPFVFSDWRSGEPSGDGPFVHWYPRSDYQSGWNDNSGEYFVVVEIDALITTPTPTPTPFQTPTPTPTPAGFIPFHGNDLGENQLVANAPAGFTLGNIFFGEIPAGSKTDGRGVEIRLAPGQGAFIVSNEVFDAPTLSKISGLYRATSSDLIVALIALNSPIDGQIGYTNISGEEVPVGDYRQLNLYYAPPSGKVQLGIQAVNSPFSTLTSTLWVDNLKVEPITSLVPGDAVSMDVDGNFEGELESLITNFNDMDGTVTLFFESLLDIAVRLAVTPDQMAANIGDLVTGVENSFPMTLMGDVSVFRDSPPGGGLLAFVMTNGFQNTALFRHVDELPDMNSIKQEHLIIGSDFTVNNPNIPIHVVVQNGGPGAESSVVIDDLQVRSYEVIEIPKPPILIGSNALASSVLRDIRHAHYAVDSDFATYWQPDIGASNNEINDPEWWQYDFGLGSEIAVRQIRMYQTATGSTANPLTNTAETVSVLYSNDGNHFYSAGTFSSLGLGLNTLNIGYVGAYRYWRIFTEDSNDSWGIYEFEFEYY